VLPDLDAKAVCTRCGMIGADVRPNWSKRAPSREPERSAVAAIDERDRARMRHFLT
jgi:hypothetical protein